MLCFAAPLGGVAAAITPGAIPSACVSTSTTVWAVWPALHFLGLGRSFTCAEQRVGRRGRLGWQAQHFKPDSSLA